MRKPLYGDALDAEEEGDLGRAATDYVGLGTYLLAESDYQNSRRYREGVTFILLAISHDICGDNTVRARSHFGLFQEKFEQITTTADEDVVRGFGHEWLGDARLMVGEEGVSDAYKTARELFEGMELNERLVWGAVPEYDTAYKAMCQFFESHGYGYHREHDIEFVDRIHWKLETARKL